MVGEHNAYAFPRPQTTTFSTGLRGRTGQQSQCLRALGLGSRGEAAPQHPVHLELLHRSTKRTLTSGGWEGLGGAGCAFQGLLCCICPRLAFSSPSLTQPVLPTWDIQPPVEPPDSIS